MEGFTRTFTDEDVIETIQSAIDVTNALDCPDDLRTAAFAGALNMVGNMQVKAGALAIPSIQFQHGKLQ
jgi:hypothetical protein